MSKSDDIKPLEKDVVKENDGRDANESDNESVVPEASKEGTKKEKKSDKKSELKDMKKSLKLVNDQIVKGGVEEKILIDLKKKRDEYEAKIAALKAPKPKKEAKQKRKISNASNSTPAKKRDKPEDSVPSKPKDDAEDYIPDDAKPSAGFVGVKNANPIVARINSWIKKYCPLLKYYDLIGRHGVAYRNWKKGNYVNFGFSYNIYAAETKEDMRRYTPLMASFAWNFMGPTKDEGARYLPQKGFTNCAPIYMKDEAELGKYLKENLDSDELKELPTFEKPTPSSVDEWAPVTLGKKKKED